MIEELEKRITQNDFTKDKSQIEDQMSEPLKSIDLNDLDLHHLYVKELTEPSYSDIKDKSSGKYGFQFNKTFLPNGQPVAIKSANNQHEALQKLYMEDWSREMTGYKTTYTGEVYHLVKNKNGPHY